MGTIGLPKNMFLITVLVIISIGLTAGVVYAGVPAVTHTGDVVIEEDTPGTGSLSIVDGNLRQDWFLLLQYCFVEIAILPVFHVQVLHLQLALEM